MSNRSKIIVGACIVAGIAGLILLDLSVTPRMKPAPDRAAAEEHVVAPQEPKAAGAEIIDVSGGTGEVAPPPIVEGPAPDEKTQPADPVSKGVTEPAPSPEPAREVKHVVRPGESWWTIAEKHYGAGKGHLYRLIQKANPQVKGRFLTAGEELTIPPPPEAPSKGARVLPQMEGAEVYTVQAGDTFESISKKFYGSARFAMEILAANRGEVASPEKLRAGQQILIPPRPDRPAPEAAEQGKEPGDTYTVEPGDSLWKIASRLAPNDVEGMIRRIIEANPDRFANGVTALRAGWKLRLPKAR